MPEEMWSFLKHSSCQQYVPPPPNCGANLFTLKPSGAERALCVGAADAVLTLSHEAQIGEIILF